VLSARVMAVAHRSQCALTDGGRDAARVTVTGLGAHTLRDIEALVHLINSAPRSSRPWSLGAGKVGTGSPTGHGSTGVEIGGGVGTHPPNRTHPPPIEDVLSKQLLCHYDPLNLVGTFVNLGVLPSTSIEYRAGS
jgi:hypothetical protein